MRNEAKKIGKVVSGRIDSEMYENYQSKQTSYLEPSLIRDYFQTNKYDNIPPSFKIICMEEYHKLKQVIGLIYHFKLLL